MTDRELLEAAAKAAGLIYPWVDGWGGILVGHGMAARVWDPLRNDGDSLRLAIALRFDVHYEWQHVPGREDPIEIVEVFYGRDEETGTCQCEMHSLDNDPTATVRRCIVRAAAALGDSKRRDAE